MPVEVTAMKNTPSKRASLLTAAWYRRSSSVLSRGDDSAPSRGEPIPPDPPGKPPREATATPPATAVSVCVTSSTMPARADQN